MLIFIAFLHVSLKNNFRPPRAPPLPWGGFYYAAEILGIKASLQRVLRTCVERADEDRRVWSVWVLDEISGRLKTVIVDIDDFSTYFTSISSADTVCPDSCSRTQFAVRIASFGRRVECRRHRTRWSTCSTLSCCPAAPCYLLSRRRRCCWRRSQVCFFAFEVWRFLFRRKLGFRVLSFGLWGVFEN